MKEFSKEIIEVDGQEYTLFLNRNGIVAWEKFCKTENEKALELEKKYSNIIADEKIEITEDTNPFEGIENFDEDYNLVSSTFRKLYWIMLYTEHKLTPKQAEEVYNKAIEEYGEDQIIALAQQMIEDANKDLVSKNEIKNLPALRPKK